MNPEAYLEALLNLPKLYTPRVSLSGEWVAWTWAQIGPMAEVYISKSDGSIPPKRLTRSDQDTMAISWAPDDQSLIVAQDIDGNERYQLFRVFLDQPEDMQPLTEANPDFFLRGGQIHPNNRWLIYSANYDPLQGTETEATWILRHDLKTGERVPIAKPEKPNYILPRMNQQGTHILYTRKDLHPSGGQVWLVDIDGKDDHEVLNFGDAKKAHASWFPDGENAVVLFEAETHRKVGIWNRNSEEMNWLIDNPERNIEFAFIPKNSNRIVVIEVRQACIYSCLIDPESGDEWQIPDSAQTIIPIAPVSTQNPEGDWIAHIYDSKQPSDLVRLPIDAPGSDGYISLTRLWDQTSIAAGDLAKAEDFRWKSEDGLDIQGWLYRGATPAKGTIVTVHGGPTYHSEDSVDTEIQFFVSRGFNVLSPNYRGSTGFSVEFQERIKEDGWGGREQDDIISGIEALIAAGIAQVGKVGITGTSYGGYSSWCALTRNPKDIIAAAAPVCGMTSLIVDYETTRPDLRPYSEEMMGGTPDQVPDRYYQRSPINFVDRIEGKLLIVQGMQDPNVTPENVRQVRTELENAGIKYDLLTFDDEGHGIFRPKNRKVLYQHLAEFFAKAFEAGS
jgi:dipeptidyl aminopeptidase/acylaminoacyl peptidase